MVHTDLALTWLVRDSTDSLEGRQARTRDSYERQGRKLADDAPLSLATVEDPVVLAYLTSHARPSVEASTDDISQIAGSLPADMHPASFILFARGTEIRADKEIAMVKIYAVKSQGRATRHILSDLQAEIVDTHRHWISERNGWRGRMERAVEELWELAKGIAEIVDPEELLVLVPGPLCLGIPVHALQHASTDSLGKPNPTVYAPNPSLFHDCVQRALTTPVPVPDRPHIAIAAVEELHPNQGENPVHVAAENIAPMLGCTPLIGVQVTRAAMAQIFAQQDWVFFIGHGHGGLDDNEKTLHQPGLLLTTHGSFDKQRHQG